VSLALITSQPIGSENSLVTNLGFGEGEGDGDDSDLLWAWGDVEDEATTLLVLVGSDFCVAVGFGVASKPRTVGLLSVVETEWFSCVLLAVAGLFLC